MRERTSKLHEVGATSPVLAGSAGARRCEALDASRPGLGCSRGKATCVSA
ncbi:hypothetical protein A7982_12251 [Minicystis rosea]|nr:hypothetical protein A7982_12251 [Minicystis rosea]